jgi:16S rRNA (guanine966-N2)-methyltransferase
MRVIAGTYRRRTLEAPPGLATRPTSDRLRETLFNVLAPWTEGAAFLDLYAGSGAVGIEALSRGAAQAVFVERAPAALKVLRANLERLKIATGFEVQANSVNTFLRKRQSGDTPFDVVFLDPPYQAEEEYEATLGLLGNAQVSQGAEGARELQPCDDDLSKGTSESGHPILKVGAVVIAEHRRKYKLDDSFGTLRRTRLLEQGDAALSFYEAAVS